MACYFNVNIGREVVFPKSNISCCFPRADTLIFPVINFLAIFNGLQKCHVCPAVIAGGIETTDYLFLSCLKHRCKIQTFVAL